MKFKPISKHLSRCLTLTITTVCMAVGLLALPIQASAQDNCLGDAYLGNPNSLNCTANDVRVSLVTVPASIECQIGEEVTFDQLQASLVSGATTRFDIGVYLSLGDHDAVFGECEVRTLSPTGEPVDLTGGYGPYRDTDGDFCGEILQADGDNRLFIDNFTYFCRDENGDGLADIGTCLSWDVNDKSVCNGAEDAFPNQGSKCRCETVNIGNVFILETGFLEVQKVLNSSYGLVNLQIDGVTDSDAANVGNGGTTGQEEVDAGTSLAPGAVHTVGETAGTGTDLGLYDPISIECRDNDGAGSVVASSSNAGPLNVTVNPDDDIVCVITNTAICNPTGVDCSGSDTLCGVASCDPTGAQDNCDVLTPIDDGSVCRSGSGDSCDPDELCVAGNTDCPADVITPVTTTCRTGSGDSCDEDESCTGIAGDACPADVVASATTTCRTGSGDSCDEDESCTGIAGDACPADVVASATTTCRTGSGDSCDEDESCTGIAGDACPADVVASATTTCRTGSGDSCDEDESCTGIAGDACPADVVASATTTCRTGSGDSCDEDESCTGIAGDACPADVVASATTTCRTGSGDSCDEDESCTGIAGDACPADVVASATTTCRTGSGDSCDEDESCTGIAGDACPADVVASATTTCRTGSGDSCDEDESCTGIAGDACPADVVASATTTCRTGSGDSCDEDESCTGIAGDACPADVVASATTTCRTGSGDSCDEDESCTGIAGDACPADVVASATTTCRTGSGDSCDEDESCTGIAGDACPADVVASATTTCRTGSGDSCDEDESCTGIAGDACPADVVASATTTCRTGSGDSCDEDESCTGIAGDACPADVVASATTTCRTGSGDSCDEDESCTGIAGDACPADVVASATTTCRTGSGDSCDEDESCTGIAGDACPADVVASATTTCRTGSGDSCDEDESCTGIAGDACPADVVASATTTCRTGSGDSCDEDESCTGIAGDACPADVVASATTTCRPGANECDPDDSCTGVPGDSCPTHETEFCAAEGCSPGFWKNHTELWDGVGGDDATSIYKTTDEWLGDLGIPECDGVDFGSGKTLGDTIATPSEKKGSSNTLFHLTACLVGSDALPGFDEDLNDPVQLLVDITNACAADAGGDSTDLDQLGADCAEANSHNEIDQFCPLDSSGVFTVSKDFSDGNTNPVEVWVTCSNGNVSDNPQYVTESSPGTFHIEGLEPFDVTTCTASEVMHADDAGLYDMNQSDCNDNDMIDTGCVMFNSLLPVDPS